MALAKTCSCGAQFTIEDEDLVFYAKVSPRFGEKVYDIPPPTFCPECRMRRRLVFRNDRSLYKAQSALSGQEIISMHDPKNGFKVLSEKEWWSDQHNGEQYGRDFDFSKPFFEQFVALRKDVPRVALFNKDSENTIYANYAPYNKSCYLVFGTWECDSCLYGQSLHQCISCADNLFVNNGELCYENVDCNRNYNTFFAQNSNNCTDSMFLFDCRGCTNCVGCYNLRQKKNYLFNQPSTKEEVDKFKATLSSYANITKFKNEFAQRVKNEAWHKFLVGEKNEDVSGNFIESSKNAHFCFNCYDSEDVKFCGRSWGQKDSYDYEGGGKGELLYDCMSVDLSFGSMFSMTCDSTESVFYSDLCFNSAHLFGCVGLKRAKYCILNKQYTREEYETLVPKIIEHIQKTGEWGEFFPMTISPFAYNETVAQEYYPLTRVEAEAKGLRWQEEPPPPQAKKTIPANKLPDTIDKIPDDVLNWAILCEKTQRPFIIQKMELEFYRKMNLPLPHLHPDERHKARMAKRNPRRLWDRNCAQCGTAMQTSYAPDCPEKVLCEECYLKEVG